MEENIETWSRRCHFGMKFKDPLQKNIFFVNSQKFILAKTNWKNREFLPMQNYHGKFSITFTIISKLGINSCKPKNNCNQWAKLHEYIWMDNASINDIYMFNFSLYMGSVGTVIFIQFISLDLFLELKWVLAPHKKQFYFHDPHCYC